ncbi:MAG: hypothetical protein JXB34_13270 [Bacteroidales bacterium]|nr:hypothetical protein [Bacteroidales bacterium]
MKRTTFSLILITFCVTAIGQVFPDKDYPILFKDIQMSGFFPNSQIFPNCVPLIDAVKIDSCYNAEKDVAGFNLYDFINTYFVVPNTADNVQLSDSSETIGQYIESLMEALKTTDDKTEGTLLQLPNPYLGTAIGSNELNYLYSYFAMLGLNAAGKYSLLEKMAENFAYLIDTYGFVPATNRTYMLSRSQPPFFALMVDLLVRHSGEAAYRKYLPQMLKEYEFWMDGKTSLNLSEKAYRRVVKLPDGEVLNRYWDDEALPRPEAYKEDLLIAEMSPEPDSVDFRNIRAAYEAGWGFSSRWLNDGLYLETIETTKILPVDLNCLLYHLEKTIARAYKSDGNKSESKRYTQLAAARKKAIQKYFWRKKDGFFVDYHFILEWQNMPNQLAGAYPLFFEIASARQAKKCAAYIETHFLHEGGLASTTKTTGYVHDAPFGHPHMQYMAIAGLLKYNKKELASQIGQGWLKLNTKTFEKTGKLYGKYDVVGADIQEEAVDLPEQDGLGATAGVFLYLEGLNLY